MKYFADLWTPQTKAEGLALFQAVYDCLEHAGMEPMIFYGTLLGACRNGKLIPWDGDFDICIDRKHQNNLPDFPYRTNYKHCGSCNTKVYNMRGEPTGKGFKWPWVDIDFYEQDGEYLNFLTSSGALWYRTLLPYPITYTTRQFEGMTCRTIAHPEERLDIMYPKWRTTYQSPLVNHKTGSRHKHQIRIPINA